ncbi:MAG: phosphate ABC transporter substrate-binding protein PstS [Solirubrobacteraceae bacterium]|nr:phosphate ABC transporter substrate-binding protein PstS [Solirubrobacteraceae bacterium]
MRPTRTITALALCGALAVGATACGGDDDAASAGPTGAGAATAAAAALSGEIAGAGASSQAAAQEAWIAGFQTANPDVTISYDPVGSGGGREQFVAGGIAFGGTDAPLAGDELAGARERCGGADALIEIPAYVSPIAIAYNLPGVEELKLDPETLARILKQEITTWDDPAIAATNEGVELPAQPITVVNRSDESGTTENLAEYLAAVAPDVWTFEVSGDWPVTGGEAAEGTSGVVEAIRNGEGTIGYADAGQVGDLGVVQVQVGDTFVGPTPEAAAEIFADSERTEGEGAHVFTYELNRETDAAGTYPIVLVSYLMACTRYDSPQTAGIVKAYLDWVISPEGQDAAAQAAGSAPLSDATRALIQPAIDAIGGGGA